MTLDALLRRAGRLRRPAGAGNWPTRRTDAHAAPGAPRRLGQTCCAGSRDDCDQPAADQQTQDLAEAAGMEAPLDPTEHWESLVSSGRLQLSKRLAERLSLAGTLTQVRRTHGSQPRRRRAPDSKGGAAGPKKGPGEAPLRLQPGSAGAGGRAAPGMLSWRGSAGAAPGSPGGQAAAAGTPPVDAGPDAAAASGADGQLLDAKLVTDRASKASTAAQLADAWHRHARPRANHYHISAFASKAAALAASPGGGRAGRRQLRQLVADVAAVALQQPPDQLDDQAVANLCHAMATLHVREPGVLQALAPHIEPRLAGMLPQHLSQVLWSYALLGVRPPVAWLQAFQEASQGALAQASPQAQANMVWALGKLGVQPGAPWWSAFWTASQQQLQGGYGAQELAAAIYGCSKLGVRPPEPWLVDWMEASCEQLSGAQPQQLSMCIWALGALRYPPTKAWLMVWFLASQGAMQRASPTDLSLWLYSLARLGYQPSRVWLASYVAGSFDRLGRMKPHELANTMWAIASMEWRPPHMYGQELLAAAGRALPVANALDLANMLFMVAKLGVPVEAPWMQAFLAHSRQRLAGAEDQQLAALATSLQRMGQGGTPDAAWIEAFLEAAGGLLRQGALRQQHLSAIVVALQGSPGLPGLLGASPTLQQQGLGAGGGGELGVQLEGPALAALQQLAARHATWAREERQPAATVPDPAGGAASAVPAGALGASILPGGPVL